MIIFHNLVFSRDVVSIGFINCLHLPVLQCSDVTGWPKRMASVACKNMLLQYSEILPRAAGLTWITSIPTVCVFTSQLYSIPDVERTYHRWKWVSGSWATIFRRVTWVLTHNDEVSAHAVACNFKYTTYRLIQ